MFDKVLDPKFAVPVLIVALLAIFITNRVPAIGNFVK